MQKILLISDSPTMDYSRTPRQKLSGVPIDFKELK